MRRKTMGRKQRIACGCGREGGNDGFCELCRYLMRGDVNEKPIHILLLPTLVEAKKKS